MSTSLERATSSLKNLIAVAALPVVGGAILVVVGSEAGRSAVSSFGLYPIYGLKTIASTVSSAAVALVTGALGHPADVWDFLMSPSREAFVSAARPLSETLMTAAPLGIAGIGVAVAFRAGLFNIGGEGQAIMGGLAAVYLGFQLDLPVLIGAVVCLLGGAAAGAAWGAIAGVIKAKAGMHEVVTTILLNYVALNLAVFLLGTSVMRRPGRSDPITPIINEGAKLPKLLGDGLRLHAGIIVLLLVAAAVAFVIRRTTIGFALRSVGASPRAALVNGISSRVIWVAALSVSGALVGLAAAVNVTGVQYSVVPGSAGSLGLDALVVALIANSRPWACLGAAFLVAALRTGGLNLTAETGVPTEVVVVMQALVLFAVVAPRLVRALLRMKTDTIKSRKLAGGWTP